MKWRDIRWLGLHKSREVAQHQSIETPRTLMPIPNSTLRLATGQLVNIFKLTPEQVRFWDFGWALHNIVRFGGHAPLRWDVLSHSALVWGLAKRELGDAFTEDYDLQAALLLHDAGEAYVGDMPRPIKNVPEAQFFRSAEDRILKTIYKRFGLDFDKVDWTLIKRFDNQALFIEMAVMFPDIRGTKLMPEASFKQDPSLSTMHNMLIVVKPEEFATILRRIIINVMQRKNLATSTINETFLLPDCLAPYLKSVEEPQPQMAEEPAPTDAILNKGL